VEGELGGREGTEGGRKEERGRARPGQLDSSQRELPLRSADV